MCYKSVQSHSDLDNGSKASDELLRPQFNDNYATITNNESQNGNGQSAYELNYDFAEHISKLNYGGEYLYGYEGQKYPIAGIDEQYLITAKTKDVTPDALLGQTAVTIDMIYSQSKEEIPFINLGLYEREMPDITIIEDIEQAVISLNGFTHTYKYNQRFENTSLEESGFNMAVKFESKYADASYTREIFSSDVSYNSNTANSLQMNVRYKISIRNEATKLYTRTNQIVNYFDERYDITSIRDVNGNEVSYTVDTAYNQNGYKRAYINVNSQNQPQSENLYYVDYKLQNEAINATLNQDVILNSVTEVTSYSTFEDEGYTQKYAGIDSDSNPGNTNPVDRETYEDDTDSAPAFIVTVKEGRKITGTVWEDAAREDLLSDDRAAYEKERKGDGKLEDSENLVGNVRVDLLSVENDIDLSGVNVLDNNNLPVAKLYKMDGSEAEATYITGNDGYYEFVGVMPGKYIIRYTYGNTSVIYDINGNKIDNINPLTYKSTIYRGGDKQAVNLMNDFWYREDSTDNENRLSDAKDEVGVKLNGERINIINYTITDHEINYGTMTNDDNKLQNIEAASRAFEVEFDYDEDSNHISEYGEYFRVEFEHIDFGIIKRPAQSLDIIKEITYIKIALNNGQVILEGDPRTEKLQHVRVLPDGNIAVEIDNELMQGATLTARYGITVGNINSEIDYNDEDYYIYGIVPNDKENKYKLASVTRVFDYLSNDLRFDSTNPTNSDWEAVEVTKELVEQGYLSQETYDVVKNHNQVMKTEAFANMKPGEKITVSMEVSRILSNSEDDFSLDNYIEVNGLKDKTIEDSIPGNYVPGDSTTEENDDDKVSITITGPTGENRNYIPYVILGISSLIILITGIVFIKKKVL